MSSALTIRVSRGTGSGPTRLAAFDAALQSAGVADLNLVRLSSVIPPGAQVVEVPSLEQLSGGHGDVLLCVYADAYASTPGEDAWAGVAWSTHTDGSGAGLFVEHSGSSEPSVRHDLKATLAAMSRTRAAAYGMAGETITSAHCVDHPVCAVVVAAYQTVGWTGSGRIGAI